MTERYIIIAERDDLLVPVVDADDPGLLAVYPSRERAEQAADNTMICRAYPYSIINFDDIQRNDLGAACVSPRSRPAHETGYPATIEDAVLKPVAALFVRRDSVYKCLDVDAYDIDRDARTFGGGVPVVAHPPCRTWGRLRQFSHGTQDEKMLGVWAVGQVRKWGGVLEHPAASTLWIHCGMHMPGRFPDNWGGWTLEVDQFHFGHRARKRTWLYIVGCDPDDLPEIPHREGSPTHCVRTTKSYPRLPSITKVEREQTPREFAMWLVEVAMRCHAPARNEDDYR